MKVSCCSGDEKAATTWWASKPEVNLAISNCSECEKFWFDAHIWKWQRDWSRTGNYGCICSFPWFPPFAHCIWTILINSSGLLPDCCFINGNIACPHHKTFPHINRIRSIKKRLKIQKYLCSILKMQWNQHKFEMMLSQALIQDRAHPPHPYTDFHIPYFSLLPGQFKVKTRALEKSWKKADYGAP